jgi:porin
MRGSEKGATVRRFLVVTAAAAIAVGASGVQAADQAKAPPSIWEQDTLTGDWGGARTALKDKGVEINLEYANEIFAVMSGGLRQQASYEGQWHFSVNTDLEKLIGWTGGKTHVTVFQIHDSGRNVIDNTGSISDPSNLDALPTTRLYTAWFEQNFAERFWVRIGQIVGDGEFFTSDTASGLINGTFGWASLFGANMTSGGPAYPLATPGVRLALKPTDQLTILAALFSGDPAGPDCNDNPQVCNRYGTTFSFGGGALWMGGVQYAVNQEKNSDALPGVYKLGGWYATKDFTDQHFGLDDAGKVVSLADPTVAGPLNHRGDWGIYGVADQMVWRADKQSLNLFLRGGISPSDRNLISYYVDGGAGFKGPLPGRADDVLTFGVAYAKISRDAAALDQDTLALNGPPYPIRDEEVVFELSYQAQIAPWWTMQPDLQYIVHPGGNVPDPNNPYATVGNAFVVGVRSTIKF